MLMSVISLQPPDPHRLDSAWGLHEERGGKAAIAKVDFVLSLSAQHRHAAEISCSLSFAPTESWVGQHETEEGTKGTLTL